MRSTHIKGWSFRRDTPATLDFHTRPSMVETHVFGVVQARYSESLPAGQTVKGQSGADTQWLRRQTTGITRTS
ncbi:hypothetical protein IG631_01939 [Alternaria alternata]|nr:hypothetical protein IG631_01939 [Alternaria alternata]